MLRTKVIYGILVVLCLFKRNQTVEIVKKSREFPDNYQVYLSDYSFKDALLVYAVCAQQISDSERKCIINQEVSPYESIARSCNVTIKTDDEDGKVSDLFVATLYPDKAILVWLEEGTRIIAHVDTVDLNKCTISKNEFADSENNNPIIYWQLKYGHTIVPYKTSYDVFFKNESCGDKECKVGINAEGKIVSRPSPAMNRSPHYITRLNSIDRASPDKGFAYKKFNEKDASYVIQKPDGSEKILTTSPENILYDIISTSNGKINIYFKQIGANGNTYKQTLLQYNDEGNVQLETNLEFINKSMQVVNIYSLPEGGSILLLSDLEERSPEDTSGCSKIKGFFLMKIDANGTEIGEIQMQGLENLTFYDKPTDRHWRYIWKNKQGGYCATIVGPTSQCSLADVSSENDIRIIENCFVDGEFSKIQHGFLKFV